MNLRVAVLAVFPEQAHLGGGHAAENEDVLGLVALQEGCECGGQALPGWTLLEGPDVPAVLVLDEG